MLKASNLASAHTYIVSENIPFSTKTLSVPRFFWKKSPFLAKVLPLLKAIM